MAEYFRVRLHVADGDDGILAWEKVEADKVLGYFNDAGEAIPTNSTDLRSVTYVSRAPRTPPFDGGDK